MSENVSAAALSQGWGPTNVYFHLHLVSDSTGETLQAYAQAVCAQFEEGRPILHIHPLIRSPRQLDRALAAIEDAPGLVLYTLMKEDKREALETLCLRLGLPHLSVLDPAIAMMGRYLGIESSHRLGGQHELDQRYFARIDALNYTLAHDDGQNVAGFHQADIVLLGISRTSKTPTSLYLANRGYKTANLPLVPGVPLPPDVEALEGMSGGPLVVGLIASPERIVQIRRNRLMALHETQETDYVAEDRVRDEMASARKLFLMKGWPMIDVSRRAIEETAAAVIALLNRRRNEGLTLAGNNDF
jgi:regulator of PEP synthase PpsR (kinase-PPPase family)